jgi:hypothetical protein
MPAVIAVALPVFAVIAAGCLAGRFGLAGAADCAALNRFVFRFAMPAALFALMSGGGGLGSEDLRLALAYGAAALAVLFGAYVLARSVLKLDAPAAGAHALASALGNAVFLGLPIALQIDGWAAPFAKLMLVEWILVIGAGVALMEAPGAGRGPRLAPALRALANPILAAALAGFALASSGVALPGPLRAALEILGRAAGPAALFALGLFLATRDRLALAEKARNVVLVALMKMAALPALALVIYVGSGPASPQSLGALALFTATPTAVAAFVMAGARGRYAEESAAAIAATTVLSIFTIGLVLLRFA